MELNVVRALIAAGKYDDELANAISKYPAPLAKTWAIEGEVNSYAYFSSMQPAYFMVLLQSKDLSQTDEFGANLNMFVLSRSSKKNNHVISRIEKILGIELNMQPSHRLRETSVRFTPFFCRFEYNPKEAMRHLITPPSYTATRVP